MEEYDLQQKDYLVSRIISKGKEVDGYSKIYYQANENLIDYLDVDFQDKDVLSVLASSDQVLTAKYLDAKKTDSFDYNRLTYYYYYLRIWSIKYMNKLYPLILNGNDWLKELLKLVKPTTEGEHQAFDFWKKHVVQHTNLFNLFYDIDAQPEGKTLYTHPEELKDYLDPNLTFFHLNLFEQFKLNTTYDILLISNILDWARGDQTRLQIAHDNIGRLLNKDGIVICSNLVNRSLKPEIEVFSDYEFNQVGRTYTYQKK